MVAKEFVDAGSGKLQSYTGLVVDFDPKDPDQQFHVLYEDGDDEWLPASALVAILTASLGVAADIALLSALAEQTIRSWSPRT